MSLYTQPPIYDPVVNETDLKANLSYILFFNNIVSGDIGQVWNPNFVNLTEVGVSVKTGVYFAISNALAYFRVIITPATNTSSVAGSTYIDNFPLRFAAPAGFFAIAGDANAALGTTNASNNRIYTPSWTTITTPIILSGIIEAT